MAIDTSHIRKLDMTLLLVFQEVLRHRKTTLAARHLGLSQSAVSHALSRLREIFADPLFLRRRDGLQPTARALALGTQVARLIDLASETVRAGRDFDPATSTRLFRVAANDLFCTLLAPPLLAELRRIAPAVRLTFRYAVSAQALEGLKHDDLDLAVGRFYELPGGFESTALGEEGFVVVARRNHPLIRSRLTLKRWLACEHLLVSFSGGLHGASDDALAGQGLKRNVAASMPLFFAALASVASSDLIAAVPARLAAAQAKRFKLAVHLPPLAIAPFPVSLIRHERSKSDAGLDWLAAKIATCYRALPQLPG